MSNSRFVYVTYIRTTPERLWSALTTKEFTEQYWLGAFCESSLERELEGLVAACDCVISLRWPTAGETSAILMRALGAGRVVITTDLPQYRELPDEFCRKVPHEPGLQASRLVREMRSIAADPDGTARRGALAAAFVERTASPVVVAESARCGVSSLIESRFNFPTTSSCPCATWNARLPAGSIASRRAMSTLAVSSSAPQTRSQERTCEAPAFPK